MNQELWTRVDDYLTEALLPKDEALAETVAACEAAGLPAIAVSATQGRLLELLARAVGARDILEIGTLGAYSTLWLARGLTSGGRIITLESDPKHARVAQDNIARAGFRPDISVRVGPALETLPALVREKAGPFDLVFIDADKANLCEYVQWSMKLSRPGTMIVVDNVIRDGAVIDALSTDPSVQGVRRMNEYVASETRIAATALQTVGVKGYDGFALLLLKN
jgi:predicted O-methyltransferase YrrM